MNAISVIKEKRDLSMDKVDSERSFGGNATFAHVDIGIGGGSLDEPAGSQEKTGRKKFSTLTTQMILK